MSRDRATTYLDDNPVDDENFTTDKKEAIRLGIYYRPVCECGCGEPSQHSLGSYRKGGPKVRYVASWECRSRVRASGLTRNTSIHGFGGMRFVSFDKHTGNIIEPEAK